MVTSPALLTVAPVILKILLTELAALPMFTAPPSRFQVVLSATVTVLLDEPAPMVRPVLQSCALVAIIWLKPPPLPPMVIRPLEATPPVMM